MGMLLISAQILDPFWKLRSCRKWDKGMDINPEDETSYTTQYQEAFLKYVENEYCAKLRRAPVHKLEKVRSSNLVPSATASGSYQSSFDPYDLSSDDEEYLTPNNVPETTPGRSDGTARLLTAARLYLNSPPEAPKNWGQINPNLNEYHSDPMEISSTFCIPDITDCWRQQEETHSKYANLSNVAHDIFSIIPHGVRVEASFPLAKVLLGGGSQKPQARPFAKKSLSGSLLEPITRFWQALTEIWIPHTPKMARQWRKRRRKGNCTELPRFMTFWRCGRAAEIYVRPRMNLALKTSRWPPYDTFRTLKRALKHPGHSFNMMLRLHSNCQKDHLCHQLCLQRTSLENELRS